MDGNTRRQNIIKELEQTDKTISGSLLAKKMGVSRQVIVQDIALLRNSYPILATAQGYLLYQAIPNKCIRTFLVKHDRKQIFDELSSIVSLGGTVKDVVIEHDVYGQLRADLNLKSEFDVKRFCKLLETSNCGPLFPISSGVHLHTVEADSEAILDKIQQILIEKGYFIN